MTQHALLSLGAKAWRCFSCLKSELRLDLTLGCGQTFRWRDTGEGHWTGVMGGRVWTLTQTDDALWYYVYGPQEPPDCLNGRKRKKTVGFKKSKKSKEIVEVKNEEDESRPAIMTAEQEAKDEEVLRDYFQLSVKLEDLYKVWSDADPHFSHTGSIFSGVRILRQDPVECLFSFICSSNNHITRIQGMVERLCAKLGTPLCKLDGTYYHDFPSIEALAGSGVEVQLRDLGFGYRAGFVQKSAHLILMSHGPKWLHTLRNVPYLEARAALLTLPGVGPKVADCVCLMSLDKSEALPVDTHVWQIARRDYDCAAGSDQKTLTEKVYKEIGDFFRTLWGSSAGWAHSKPDAEGGRKKESITVEMKKAIIKKHRNGMRVRDLSKHYNKSASTICTILKNKDKLVDLDTAKGITINCSSKQRPRVLDEVENLLLVWITAKQLAGDTVSEAVICEKARMLYGNLVNDLPGSSSDATEFKASRGWFENFKRRTGIHVVTRNSQAASADVKAAEKFVIDFKKLIDSEQYVPQQVFNCDETGLFWKKMPRRTFIAQNEAKLPGHKPMKDRLTLTLCANASGDLKIKPLLVYTSEDPRAFKRRKVQKDGLPVMWRSNSRAWVNKELCAEWINSTCGPQIKNYLLDNNLPLKAVLVMDNAPAHTNRLQHNILEEYQFMEIVYLPPNTTAKLQPMGQAIISNFKKLYTKGLFELCFNVTEGTQLTLQEFWSHHFDIVGCLKLIDAAWRGVSTTTLNSAWRKLWPECVVEPDFKGSMNEKEPVEEIVSLGKSLGLEVDENDVEELVAEHSEELTIDELKELHRQQHQEIEEDLWEGDEKKMNLTTAEIKEHAAIWLRLRSFVEDNHPDTALATRAIKSFNRAMSHFREVLKSRQKQLSIEKLFTKVEGSRLSGTKRSGSKKRSDDESKKRKLSDNSDLEDGLPDIIMEVDSPSKQYLSLLPLL